MSLTTHEDASSPASFQGANVGGDVLTPEHCDYDSMYMKIPTARFLAVLQSALNLGVDAVVKTNDPSHDPDHLMRVIHLAGVIGRREGHDSDSEQLVIAVGAALHDYADAKLLKPGETKQDALDRLDREFLRPQVEQRLFTAEESEKILRIVERTGFSVMRREASLPEPPPAFPELNCVRDADLLDSIGAHGIVRCVVFGAVRGRSLRTSDTRLAEWVARPGNSTDPPPFECDVPVGGSVEHFYEKLLRVPGVLATQTAKQLAVPRIQIMKAWLQQLDHETDAVLELQ